MESLESKSMNGTGMERKEVRVANKRRVGKCESLLRILAFAFTFVAALILGLDKQTKVVPIKLLDTLPPISVPVSAKWHYLSAFLYFVVANAIGCSYAAVSLVVGLANGSGLGLVVAILDVVMVGLLFSSNGAAAAIGLMGFEGNSHVQWNKVCDVFDTFCDKGAAALVVSLLGAMAFLLLVILAIKRFHHSN